MVNKATYLLKHVYQLWGLAGRLTDENGKRIAAAPGEFCRNDPVFCSRALLEALLRCGLRSAGQYRAYGDGEYWYYVYYGEQRYVIWGPVVFEAYSKQDKMKYCKGYGAKGDGIRIPQMGRWSLEGLIAFSHGILFDEYERAAEFDNRMEKDVPQEALPLKLLNIEREYAEWGIAPGEEWMLNDLVIEESRQKAAEYGVVTGITLAARYAVAEGVQEDEAYVLRDEMLQKLARAEGDLERFTILDRARQEFGQLGREARKNSKDLSLYVEQSREYITRHIYEKLSLPKVADEVGISKSYLSRIFSEQMGMTLTEYILREKISISCDLLEFSDRSIAMIADDLRLSPQSYFTKVFKKIMRETPQQYRRRYRDE